MYKFIFYFIYKKRISRDGNKFVAKYSSCLIVTIAIFIHAALFYAVSRFCLCYFGQISIARVNAIESPINKLINLLIIFLLFILVFRYYNDKRITLAMDYYSNQSEFYSYKNIFKFISLLAIPLITSILLVNRSVLYCNV